MEKHQDEAVSTQLALYKAIFSHAPQLAYLIDQNCAFLDCNHKFLKHLGLTSLDDHGVGAVYKYMKGSGFWTEQQLQMMKKKDIEVILSGEASIDQAEVPMIDKEGTIHHYLISRLPLFDKNNKVIALLVQLKDISEQKSMEEQLEKIKKELIKLNASNLSEPIKAANLNFEMPEKALRVLVVEDNVMAQKAAQKVLMQVDCVVDVADSEKQLNYLFKPGKYDLVLMDIGLEQTTGYMLAKIIRAQEKETKHHVPIVALTSYNAALLRSECKRYNMEGAITKPLTLEQARQLIQHYVFHIELPVSGLQRAS